MAYLDHLHQQQGYQHQASPFQQQQQQQQQHHHMMQHQQLYGNNGQQQQQHRHRGGGGYGGGGGGGGYGYGETEEDRFESAQAEELLDSDSRHELMLPMDFLPCPNTVIVGRGKKVAQHAGNVRFRALVKHELTEYSAATTKAHKSSIIVRVLTEVRNKSHYAFVKQDLATLRWYRVEETAQRITTAQAFRDALKDNYKSSRAFKKLKREEEKKTVDKKDKKKKEPKKGKLPPKNNSASSTAKEAPPSPVPEAAEVPAAVPEAAVPEAAMPEAVPAAAELSLINKEEPPKERSCRNDKKKPQFNDEALSSLRGMLDDLQTGALSGAVRLWQPPAGAVAGMDEDKKMPPPSAIPSASVSSCSSLLWSTHSKWDPSNHSKKHQDPYASGGTKSRSKDRDQSNHSAMKWSNHSIKTLSNHSIMTISGHSTRSNSTFNGLMKYAAPPSGDMVAGNPFEPRPIAITVQEDDDDGGAMDMELDDVLTSTSAMTISHSNTKLHQQQQQTKSYQAKPSTTFDEGIAMGLGNLSDHSLMSNMSSIHSVKFTAEEIFADAQGSMHDGSSRHNDRRERSSSHRNYHPSSRYRHRGSSMAT